MLRSRGVWLLLAGAAIGAFAMLPLRAQDEAKPEVKPAGADAPEILRFLPEDEPDNESLVEEALERYVSLQVKDLPLRALTEAVAKKGDMSVVINEQALTDERISPDAPITLNVSRITLRSALNQALEPLQLRSLVKDGVLMITTAAEAVNNRTTRVYDVTDLLPVRDDEDAARKLIHTIMDSTGGEPDGPWQEIDGEGGVANILTIDDWRLLVVRHTGATQREIEQLLADLRSTREEEDAEEEGPAIATTAAAVERRLNRRVNVNFDDVSWQTAVKTIAAGIGVLMQIDPVIGEESQVTMRLKDVKASTALERLLKPRQLAWQVSDTGLRVARVKALDQELEVQVYDVREFFRIPTDPKTLDFKSLIELIERLEGPPKAEDKEPALTIAGTEMQGLPMLVVKAPHDRQVRIAALIKEMRAARHRFKPFGSAPSISPWGPGMMGGGNATTGKS